MGFFERDDFLRPKYPQYIPRTRIPREGLLNFKGNITDGVSAFAEAFSDEFIPTVAIQKFMGTHYTDDIANARFEARQKHPANPDYNPARDPIIQQLDPVWQKFAYDLESEQEALAYATGVERHQTEVAKRAESGLYGSIGLLGGAIANPGSLLSIMRIGTAKRLAGAVSAVAVDEAILSTLQPERQLEQSLMAVGGFASIGGAILGASKINKAVVNRRLANTEYEAKILNESFKDDIDDLVNIETGNVAKVKAEDLNASILERNRSNLKDDLDQEPFSPAGRPEKGDEMATPEPDPAPERVNIEELGEEGDRIVKAFGLEKLPIGPVREILSKGNVYARSLISDLVEHPYLLERNINKNATGIAVDRAVKTNWISPLARTMMETEEIYLRYRQRVGLSSADTIAGQHLRDLGGRNGQLGFSEFLDRVGRAKRRGSDDIPEVMEASNLWHENIYRKMGESASRVGLFSQALRRDLNRVMDDLRNAQKMGGDDELIASFKNEANELRKQIREMDNLKPSPTFLNRIYRKDLIKNNRDGFKAILLRHGRSEDESEKVIESILDSTPLRAEDDLSGVAEEMIVGRSGKAASLRERSLGDIDDMELEDFLEHNIFAVGKYYTTRVAPDLELTKKFGSIDMYQQLRAIADKWDEQIAKTKKASEKIKFQKQKEDDLENLRVVRDRIRGTYGLPDNPDGWTNRSIRVAKMFNATTMLTGAIAAVPDMMRIVMYDGMQRSFGTIFDAYKAGFTNIARLSKQEAQLAGEALDMYMSMRASLFADLSDAQSTTSAFERVAAVATQQFFNVSLMNPWNVGVKTMASLVTGSRIIEESVKWSSPLRNSAKAKIIYGENTTSSGSSLMAFRNKKNNTVTVDLELLRKGWENKVWTQPQIKNVDPLPENQFKNFDEWKDFIVEHELAHADVRPIKGETKGAYENRINQIALKRMGVRGKVSKDYDQTTLAKSGIDANMAARISVQFEQHGLRNGRVMIARTQNWTDKEAAKVYTSALGKEINQIIVTPGSGETPKFLSGGFEKFQPKRKAAREAKKASGEKLSGTEQIEETFMSPQMAQLLLQFKTFGASATERVLVAGLQRPDSKFLIGAAGLVGLGMLIDKVRDDQLGRKHPKSTGEWIKRGIERGGIIGWFSDANGALETLTDGRFGLGPVLGEPQRKSSMSRKAGIVGGPIVQQGKTISNLILGLSDGRMGKRDASYARQLIPANRVFWADGLFDYGQDKLVGAEN